MTARKPYPPRRQDDIELGKICAWLKAKGLTMHVTLAGRVELREKE